MKNKGKKLKEKKPTIRKFGGNLKEKLEKIGRWRKDEGSITDINHFAKSTFQTY